MTKFRSSLQFGFQQKYLTTHALICLVEKIRNEIEVAMLVESYGLSKGF